MLTMDSSTGDLSVFKVLHSLLDIEGVILPELRSIVVMSGNIKLYNSKDCFGFILYDVDKKLRAHAVAVKVDAIILIDKSTTQDLGSSLDMILNKYGITWDTKYGFETLVGMIEELDTNGNLDTWVPIEVEHPDDSYNPYENVSDNDLDSFLTDISEYEECDIEDCPHVEKCTGDNCKVCDECLLYCTCEPTESVDGDFSDEDNNEDDDICPECGEYDDCICDEDDE